MTDLLTNQQASFMVGELAHSPIEVLEGNAPIINDLGNIALFDFRQDILNPSSRVRLDESVEPSVLHLNEAIATSFHGETNESNGRFVPDGSTRETKLVSGTFSGPESDLKVSEYISSVSQ